MFSWCLLNNSWILIHMGRIEVINQSLWAQHLSLWICRASSHLIFNQESLCHTWQTHKAWTLWMPRILFHILEVRWFRGKIKIKLMFWRSLLTPYLGFSSKLQSFRLKFNHLIKVVINRAQTQRLGKAIIKDLDKHLILSSAVSKKLK